MSKHRFCNVDINCNLEAIASTFETAVRTNNSYMFASILVYVGQLSELCSQEFKKNFVPHPDPEQQEKINVDLTHEYKMILHFISSMESLVCSAINYAMIVEDVGGFVDAVVADNARKVERSKKEKSS
jgi:hypothetical protein